MYHIFIMIMWLEMNSSNNGIYVLGPGWTPAFAHWRLRSSQLVGIPLYYMVVYHVQCRQSDKMITPVDHIPSNTYQ
jgi:hypothetical protein